MVDLGFGIPPVHTGRNVTQEREASPTSTVRQGSITALRRGASLASVRRQASKVLDIVRLASDTTLRRGASLSSVRRMASSSSVVRIAQLLGRGSESVQILPDDEDYPTKFPRMLRYVDKSDGTYEVFAITGRSAPSELTVTFSVNGDSTAVSGTDYTIASMSVTIAKGATISTALTVTLLDTNWRKEKLLRLQLSSVTGGEHPSVHRERNSFDIYMYSAVSVASAQLPGSGSASHDEDAGAYNIPVTLGAAQGEDCLVDVELGGTAVKGTHYTISPDPELGERLTIAAGATTGNVVVTPVNGSLASDVTVVVTLDHEAAHSRVNISTNTTMIEAQDGLENTNLVPEDIEYEHHVPGKPVVWASGCNNLGIHESNWTFRHPSIKTPDLQDNVTVAAVRDSIDGKGCIRPSYDAMTRLGGWDVLAARAFGDTIKASAYVKVYDVVADQSPSVQVQFLNRTRQTLGHPDKVSSATFDWSGSAWSKGTTVRADSGSQFLSSVDAATEEFTDGDPKYVGNGWYRIGFRYTLESDEDGHVFTLFFFPASQDVTEDDAASKKVLLWGLQMEVSTSGLFPAPVQPFDTQWYYPRGQVTKGAAATFTLTLVDV